MLIKNLSYQVIGCANGLRTQIQKQCWTRTKTIHKNCTVIALDVLVKRALELIVYKDGREDLLIVASTADIGKLPTIKSSLYAVKLIWHV